MENIFGIVTLVGLGLVIIGYLLVVLAGFKHHFVTGLIAMIPVVNLVVMPSTWHRAGLGFIIALVGLLLTFGGWYGGGDRYIDEKLSVVSTNKTEPVANGDADDAEEPANAETPEQGTENEPEQETVVEATPERKSDGNIVPLPNKPLYHLGYQQVSLDELSQLTGEYIRVTDNQKHRIEGKLMQYQDQKLQISQQQEVHTLMQTDITRVEKIVKTDAN
jgi:hypothetical protein